LGYYGNGFIFTSTPAWPALETLPSNFGFTGYRHKASGVFALDVWKCTGHQHWPFTDMPGQVAMPPLPGSTEDVLERFNEICETIRTAEITEAIYGEPLLRLTAYLSSILGVDTFFFAADDELTDMAARARVSRLTDFRVRFGAYAVDFSAGAFRVTPRSFVEDGEIAYSENVLARIRALPGTTVTDPERVMNGNPLYESAVQLWPPDAGDPAKLLGIGTWDPFLQIEEDFSRVASRICPVTRKPRQTPQLPPIKPARKPWWRFW
jgi:hypothetical protein